MEDVYLRFIRALEEFGMDRIIDDSDRVIVAFSGGADSHVLLHLLVPYLRERNKEILCAHVNHMIRGEDAFRDEEKCVGWAKEAGVDIKILRTDVPSIAENEKTGIEETARKVRYGFFEKLCSELPGKTVVATAHNADDNLETVLFNMMRGASIKGLCGIPPVREGKYIRPLILCPSQMIRDYCRKKSIQYSVDKTNTDLYSRNYIREKITPELRHLTADPADQVSKMCSMLKRDDDYLTLEAKRFIKRRVGGSVPKDELKELHDAVLSRVLILLYKEAVPDKSLSSTHVRDMISALRSDKGALSLCLPGNCDFTVADGGVSFKKRTEGKSQKRIGGVQPLRVDGDPFIFEDYAVRITKEPLPVLRTNENIYNLFIHKLTDFDKIKGDFSIRSRCEGDVYRYGGMTRKVKKLLSERKIPVKDRDCVPLVCDDDGIVWIPGFPLRDGTSAADKNSEKAVYICYYRKQKGTSNAETEN